MGSVGSALDPTSGGFMGGGLGGRVGGDVLTGGLAEFGRNDPFGVPKQYGLPIAGGVGGALLGGPTGALLGSSLGNAFAGGPLAATLGLGAGGLAGLMGGIGGGGGLGGLQGLLGGSLLGLGLSKDTNMGNVNIPTAATDDPAFQQQSGYQNQLINDLMNKEQGMFGQQNQQYGQLAQSQRDQLMNQLTTGPEGEAFREKYNNLGLLDSGAFNTGLAKQFGNLASQQQQDILGMNINQTGQLSNILRQGEGVQSELGLGQLQRGLGLEDTNTQFQINKAIQDARNAQAEQQSLLGTGGYLLGGGMGGGMGGGGGGGNPFSFLSGIPGMLGGMFGGGGGSSGPTFPQGQPTMGTYPGGPLSLYGGLPGSVPGALQPW